MKRWKKLIGLAVSLLVLALLWRAVDPAAIWAAMRGADPLWLGIGLAMVVPLTLVTAWRFRLLARADLGMGEATRLILAASTLNLALPSKMGDVAKAWVLVYRHRFAGERALSLVVFEKMLDMASLLAWGVPALLWVGGRDAAYWLAAAAIGGLFLLLALLLAPVPLTATLLRLLARWAPARLARRIAAFQNEWTRTVEWFWGGRRAGGIVAMSFLLWGGHLFQFWLFARALGPAMPLLDNMAFATLSILAGLMPLTAAGMGTRDAAIVGLYGPALGQGAAAVLGVLATSRYLIPALAGLPFLGDYWQRDKPRPDAVPGTPAP